MNKNKSIIHIILLEILTSMYVYFIFYNFIYLIPFQIFVFFLYHSITKLMKEREKDFFIFQEITSFCTIMITSMKHGYVYQYGLEEAKTKVNSFLHQDIDHMISLIQKNGDLEAATSYFNHKYRYWFVDQFHQMVLQIDKTGLTHLEEPFLLMQQEIDELLDDIQIHLQNKKSFHTSFFLFFLMTLGLGLAIQFSFTSKEFYLKAIHTPWISIVYIVFIFINLIVVYQAEKYYNKPVIKE